MGADSNQTIVDLRDPGPWRLLEALLYSVSHDLRSPLLTMTLSADLIEEGLSARNAIVSSDNSDNVAIGLAALRQGAADLDRMLEALTQLSRARRRDLAAARTPMQMVLSDYETVADGDAWGETIVLTDTLAVREFIDILADDQPIEIVVRAGVNGVELDMPAPRELPSDDSPLDLLVGSLQQFAGTQVQVLAVQQVVLNRLGVQVRTQGGRLLVELPVERGR